MYFPLTVWIVDLLVLHEPIVKEEDVVLTAASHKLYGASPNSKQQLVKILSECLDYIWTLRMTFPARHH